MFLEILPKNLQLLQFPTAAIIELDESHDSLIFPPLNTPNI